MTIHTRVAIIGGGIYGCGLLLQLVEKGWTDVTLVEKNELTAGSTWHAAGFCTHYSFNLTHVFMRQFSTELYRRLDHEGIVPTGYHRCSGLRVTHDRDRIDEFHHGASVGRQLGIDFEVIGPQEIKQIFPLMDTKNLLGALYEPTDGYVDPAQTTHAMAKLARQGGAKILRQSPVESICQRASGEWQLNTPKQEIVAEHIVCAAGFWANEVGRLMGLDLPITPMLHQYLVTDDHPDIKACEKDSIPLVRHHDYQWYTRRERDGLVLGAYEQNPQTWSIDGVPPEFGMELMEPELDRVDHLMADAIERIPVFEQAGIKTVVHGPVSYCADGQPLIGPAPGLKNAWLACGSGFGIGEGAGAGKLLAEWMVEGQPPMHMGAFDPRRFGAYADREYRVAKAVDVFATQFATHYPLEEREAGRPRKKSPVYDCLKNAGAQFGCAYGWERPNWFAVSNETMTLGFKRSEWFDAVARECDSLTKHAGLIDFSGFSKFKISGPDAAIFLDRLSANRLPEQLGEIRLCHLLNHLGRIECEFTITRTGPENFYLICAAVAERHHLDWLQHHLGALNAKINNLTEQRGVIAIAGPNARKLLQPVCDCALDNKSFPWMSANEINVAGIPVLAMRVSYTGELGWELHHPIESQITLYDALKQSPGAAPPIDVGFYAVNAMRIEKGYKAWAVELTVENTIWELGLDRFIKTENRDFLGREAILADRETPLIRRFYYFEIDASESDPIGGEAIFQGNNVVGVMVSGAFGHRVGKCLGFGLVDTAAANSGEPLAVEMIGDRRTLALVDEPAFDPSNHRTRSAD
ncbi:MAG: GcvT family protein [bacterium]